MIRLLVVDDHPVVRAGIVGMVASQDDFEIVGEAENGAEAIEKASSLTPDVVLLDLRMPVMDGVEVIERLARGHPDVRVLVLTTYDADADILRAVEAGATGYLLKDAARETLFEAVRAAARGESVLAPTVAARLMGRIRAPAEEALSILEIEVLTLVAGGASNKQAAKALHISVATVKSHLIHIFEKLGVSDRTSAVTTALERGIISLYDIGG